MDLVAHSPGLHALVTACSTPSATAGVPPSPRHQQQQQSRVAAGAMSGLTLASPAQGARNTPNKPITGMSILQLASPHSSRPSNSYLHAGGGASQSMPPPASPLVVGAHAPPPSPAQPSATPSNAQQQVYARAQAQANLLALAAEGRAAGADHPPPPPPAAQAPPQPPQPQRRSQRQPHPTHHLDDAELMSDDDDDDSQSQDEEDEEEEEEEDDGAGSASSQSCPPSPLASLAALSSDAGAPGSLSLSTRRTHRTPQQPLRRRSLGGTPSSERDRAGSGARFKPQKVSAAAGSPAFKQKKSGGENGANAGGSSCHQCKSRRAYGDLTYCTSSLHKKNKNAVCRKKFCEHCLKKFYREAAHPPGSAGNAVWKCPSCRKICCCAACRRREQRDDGTDGPVQSGTMSHEGTPMPTPLYRGESGRADREDAMMQSSPLQSSSPSPTALSMQRLLLSPTGGPAGAHHVLPGSMSPRMLAAPNPKSQHASVPSYAASSSAHIPSHPSRPSSLSPAPLDGVGAGTVATVPSVSHGGDHLASLAALSQAAMRDSPHTSMSMTVSLQKHAATMHHGQQQHHTGGGSLPSSAVSSPNDARSNGSSGSSAVAGVGGVSTGITGTPKATSTSLYSNLLLNNSLMLTPRSMPRAALAMPPHLNGGIGPPLSSLPKSASGGPYGLASMHAPPMSSSPPPAHPGSGSGTSASTVVAAGGFGGVGAALASTSAGADTGTSLSSVDNDDRSASSREEAGGVAPMPRSIMMPLVGAAAAQSMGQDAALMHVLPSFALFYAVGELPHVRADVLSILRASDGSSNRDKLHRIEALFYMAAEKVNNEEMPLHIE